MKDGIIINGVKYEAVESINGCYRCAFAGVIRGCLKHNPCFSFHPKDVIFKKLKDQEK